MTTILVSAGDLSGERHAADLVRELRRRRPEARVRGMGGEAMARAGVELAFDQRSLAVGGIFELFGSLPRIWRAWRAMLRCARAYPPDLAILVDSGGFNLPLARRLRALGVRRILYYVAPQVWAWRRARLPRLAAWTDRIAVILPFEKEFYAARGVEVDFVGHPLLDRIPPIHKEQTDASAAQRADNPRQRARRALGIDPDAPVLAIFPGSRRNELKHHLGLQLEAASVLRRQHPELVCLLGLAPTLDLERVRTRVEQAIGTPEGFLQIVPDATQDVIAAADVALTKPGTITAELMLRDRPMVVMGRVHPITAWLARRSLGTIRWALPNLLVEEAVVPELMQSDARPDRLAAELAPLFEGEARDRQRRGLARARSLLGGPGAARRTGDIVEEMLGSAGA